jgi:tripartite-type tricarboxylate transporter receptor subunit TctC
VLPQVPTVAEVGVPDFEARLNYFLMAPAGTPRPLIDRLNAEVRKVFAMAKTIEVFQAAGMEPTVSTPEEAAALIKSQRERWAPVVKAAGIRVN